MRDEAGSPIGKDVTEQAICIQNNNTLNAELKYLRVQIVFPDVVHNSWHNCQMWGHNLVLSVSSKCIKPTFRGGP